MMLIMSNFFDEENGHRHHQSSLGSNNPTTTHGTTTDTQNMTSVIRNRYNETKNDEDHRVVMKLIDLDRNETDHKLLLSPKAPPPAAASSSSSSSQLSSRPMAAHSSFLKNFETNKFDFSTCTAPAGQTVSLSSVKPLLRSVATAAPAIGSATAVSASVKSSSLAHSKLPFPWKLQQLLDDVDHSVQQQQSLLSLVGSVGPTSKWDDVVSWMPDGKAFRVHQPDVFAETIMRRYFKMSKYTSFTRQLYIYGFSKIEGGVCHGAFYHPKFVRGDRESCFAIGRNQSGDRRLKSAVQKRIKTQLMLETDHSMNNRHQIGQKQQQQQQQHDSSGNKPTHPQVPQMPSSSLTSWQSGRASVRMSSDVDQATPSQAIDAARQYGASQKQQQQQQQQQRPDNTPTPEGWLEILEPRTIEEMLRGPFLS